ncbi:MFS transporter [Catenuloplanes atrovinosus]|uniref:MFS family permease n=1 Tax=Catenuloplanes atrovinosus TaxID=137266 RepID=A0AAE3YTF4_9ACTN|nr:MFS transporter [Catenuloplanes atrovinosus]MDR7279593.1 MFS family permease [Catenuloplanes atrovinosus]
MTAPTMTFRKVLSTGGPATLAVLVGLQLLDTVDNAMFIVFAPDIRDTLGLTSEATVVVGQLAAVMVALGALPLGLLGDRRRRTVIVGVCTFVWAVAAALLGLAQSLWQLAAIRIGAGAGKANEGPIQVSLLTDAYPPAGRGRVLGLHRGAQPLGIVIGPLLATAVAAAVPAGQEAWRWAFVLLAVPAILLGVAALRLREPVRGHVEREALLGDDPVPVPLARPVTLRATFARLRRIRTFYLVMIALGALGLCVGAVPSYLSLILGDELGQGAGARGVITAVTAVGGLAGAVLGGVYGDRVFRRSPVASLYLAVGALAVLGAGFAVQAYAPNVATYVVVGMIAGGMTFAGLVPLSIIVAAVTPPEIRATAFGLVGLYLSVVGGLGGALVISVLSQVWGPQAAVAVVAPAASVVAGLVLARAARHLHGDLDRAAADVLERRAERVG